MLRSAARLRCPEGKSRAAGRTACGPIHLTNAYRINGLGTAVDKRAPTGDTSEDSGDKSSRAPLDVQSATRRETPTDEPTATFLEGPARRKNPRRLSRFGRCCNLAVNDGLSSAGKMVSAIRFDRRNELCHRSGPTWHPWDAIPPRREDSPPRSASASGPRHDRRLDAVLGQEHSHPPGHDVDHVPLPKFKVRVAVERQFNLKR